MVGAERDDAGIAQPLSILISGASGMIGTELVRQLEADGHAVHRLVRRAPTAENEHTWSPGAGILDANLLDRMHAVVNLSGATLSRIPWTRGYRRTILDSRVTTTRTIAESMARAVTPPTVFLSASAVGIYGDRPGQRLPDGAERGEGFLADVVDEWEAASRLAPEETRVVNLRTGVVVGRGGGALAPLALLTRLGLGARVATGGEHWPWISLYDEAAAIRHLLTSTASGPVNLAGPVPATSDRLTSHLARRLHRNYSFVLPAPVISLGMGEAGRQLLLSDQKVLPSTLLADGFAFRHERVEQAIDDLFPPRSAPRSAPAGSAQAGSAD